MRKITEKLERTEEGYAFKSLLGKYYNYDAMGETSDLVHATIFSQEEVEDWNNSMIKRNANKSDLEKLIPVKAKRNHLTVTELEE